MEEEPTIIDPKPTTDNNYDVYQSNPTSYHTSLSKSKLNASGSCSLFNTVNPLDIKDIDNPKNVKIVSGLNFSLNCTNHENTKLTVTLGKYYKNIKDVKIYKKVNNELVDITDSVYIYNDNNETKVVYNFRAEDINLLNNIDSNIYVGEIKGMFPWWLLLLLIPAYLYYRYKKQDSNN